MVVMEGMTQLLIVKSWLDYSWRPSSAPCSPQFVLFSSFNDI